MPLTGIPRSNKGRNCPFCKCSSVFHAMMNLFSNHLLSTCSPHHHVPAAEKKITANIYCVYYVSGTLSVLYALSRLFFLKHYCYLSFADENTGA